MRLTPALGRSALCALTPDETSCLGFFQGGLSWTLAEDACVAAGGHLVTPNTTAENAMVAWFIDGGSTDIGASDLAVEGTFTWTSGAPWGFTAWTAGEPNAWNAGEDCADITYQGGWNDRSCDGAAPFVCEVVLS